MTSWAIGEPAPFYSGSVVVLSRLAAIVHGVSFDLAAWYLPGRGTRLPKHRVPSGRKRRLVLTLRLCS